MNNLRKNVLRVRWFSRAATLVLVALAMHFVAAEATAQRYKAGDEVEVLMFNRWQPGTVVSTGQGGMVMVEFGTLTRRQQRPFKRTDVRFAYEADALSPSRSWSDASGKFKITAVLLSVGTDEVTLRKPDMSELTVPIAKLSESDQQYIKRMEKSAGGRAGGIPQLPPLEQFAGGGRAETPDAWGRGRAPGALGPHGHRPAPLSSRSLSFDGGAPTSPARSSFGGLGSTLTPDPVPPYLKVQQGGVAFPLSKHAGENLRALIPVGGSDHWLLAAVEVGWVHGEVPTRLLWVSLASKKVEQELLLPHGEMVVDYHPPSRRLLTFSATKVRGTSGWPPETLTIWEVVPTDKQAKPIVRWEVTGSFPMQEPGWGRVLDSRYVAYRGRENDITVWDTVEKRAHYRDEQDSFFSVTPILSGTRKFLIVPEDQQVRVLEAVTGSVVSTFPCAARATGVALTDDGTRLAVLENNTLVIWDLNNPSAEPKRYRADTIAQGIRAELAWMDDEHLLCGDSNTLRMFSLKHELVVWSYALNVGWVGHGSSRSLRDVCNGHLVYAADVGEFQGVAVGAVTLPGPKVNEAVANLDPDSLMMIKPGVAVRVEVSAGGDTESIRKLLEENIAAQGWKIDPAAEIVVKAEITRAEARQVTYRIEESPVSLGNISSRFGLGKERLEQVTVQPYISTLKIVAKGQDAWQRTTSSGFPSYVRVKEGSSIQQEVDKWQKPNPEFFRTTALPQRVMDPDWKHGLGITKVTNRGLVVD